MDNLELIKVVAAMGAGAKVICTSVKVASTLYFSLYPYFSQSKVLENNESHTAMLLTFAGIRPFLEFEKIDKTTFKDFKEKNSIDLHLDSCQILLQIHYANIDSLEPSASVSQPNLYYHCRVLHNNVLELRKQVNYVKDLLVAFENKLESNDSLGLFYNPLKYTYYTQNYLRKEVHKLTEELQKLLLIYDRCLKWKIVSIEEDMKKPSAN